MWSLRACIFGSDGNTSGWLLVACGCGLIPDYCVVERVDASRISTWTACHRLGLQDEVQTTLRCCNNLEEWLNDNQAEQQYLTSSEAWRLSCTEVERQSTELIKIVDEISREQRPEMWVRRRKHCQTVLAHGK